MSKKVTRTITTTVVKMQDGNTQYYPNLSFHTANQIFGDEAEITQKDITWGCLEETFISVASPIVKKESEV